VSIFFCLFFISFLVYGGEKMKIISKEFSEQGKIPKKFTCQGQDISPQLTIENIPQDAKSLALIVDDPDAPMGTWVHWVVFNIKPKDKIAEGEIPGTQGINDFGKLNYGGPCPPSGTHRYFFKLYALDVELNLEKGCSKEDLETAMQGHILEKAELVGIYKKT